MANKQTQIQKQNIRKTIKQTNMKNNKTYKNKLYNQQT